MKKTPAKGHTRKHTGTRKHKATTKHHPVHHPKGATAHGHNVHTVAKHPTHAKARGLALADGVACCAAEALAASLRLAGGRVYDDDVLELHEAVACCHDAEAPILAALAAAAEFGLAGCRPVFAEHVRGRVEAGRVAPQEHAHSGVLGNFHQDLLEMPPGVGARAGQDLVAIKSAQLNALVDLGGDALQVHGLILGVELPGPHAVTVDDRGRWWSWGRPWDRSDFPAAVIEEAWAVVWS